MSVRKKMPSRSCGLFVLRTGPGFATLSLFCCLCTFVLWSPNAAKDFIDLLSNENCVFSFSGKDNGREPELLFASSFEQRQATLSHLAGKEIVELGKLLTAQAHQRHQRHQTFTHSEDAKTNSKFCRWMPQIFDKNNN